MTDDAMDDRGDFAMNYDELLELLSGALIAADPVPERVLDGARAAFTWRTIDTELAEIVFDSSRELAGVRSDEANRQLTFRAPGVEIEVMVIEDGLRRLVGQLVPPSVASVELVVGDAVRAVQTDRLGRFAFEDLAPGPVRLAVRDPNGGSVQTDWVLF